MLAAVDLGVLAVELAADLREAVRGDELVAEALPLLLVAGDALGELQADVLQVDEVVDPRRAVEGGAAAVADLGQVVALLEVGVAALRAALHRGGHQIVRRLDVVGAEVEIDLVDAVACALVVDERARAELGDRQEARARDELVAALALAPARDVGRERQAREVVAGQEALAAK